MPALWLRPATEEDVAELAALHREVNRDMAERYGIGPWSSTVTERGVRWKMHRGTVYVVRKRGEAIATLTLTPRKPWAIDASRFTPVKRPLYLIGMAVLPSEQGKGTGRRCLEEALRIAREWPADAVRLDAFDVEAGAGGFYRKCGFREACRKVYRTVPLIYFEALF